jgi:hypothetical protein
MFLAAENFTVDANLVITILVIIALILGILWLWRHR